MIKDNVDVYWSPKWVAKLGDTLKAYIDCDGKLDYNSSKTILSNLLELSLIE